MYKLLGLVAVLASLSFGDPITIDLPVSQQGWDHNNASLIGVDLASYIGADEELTGAYLKFTGIQNLMEPENNDKLWANLLKYNKDMSNTVDVSYLPDGQAEGNYFKKDDSNFKLKTELLCYTDNNDVGAKVETAYKVAYWESTRQYLNEQSTCLQGDNPYYWRYLDYPNNSQGSEWVQYVENGNNVNSIWRKGSDGKYYEYKTGNNAKNNRWTKYSGWTTDEFNVALNLNDIKDLMASSNGKVGFGIDADCHYIGKVSLVIDKTTNVPEPTLISLLGCSLLGLLFIRRKK